jgi:hypothetical protein
MNGLVRALAVAGVSVVCAGCYHRCAVAYHAATALDAACAAAGLETSDPELLMHCATQALTTKRALRHGACAAHVMDLRP